MHVAVEICKDQQLSLHPYLNNIVSTCKCYFVDSQKNLNTILAIKIQEIPQSIINCNIMQRASLPCRAGCIDLMALLRFPKQQHRRRIPNVQNAPPLSSFNYKNYSIYFSVMQLRRGAIAAREFAVCICGAALK